MNPLRSKKWKSVLEVLLGTFILSLIGLYNEYPLVYSDTGTYIYSGFDLFVPKDRPIAYGLFIRAISMKWSLWPVVILQNFLTALLLHRLFKTFQKKVDVPYLLTILFLTAFTAIGWYSNQIMPDFFTPLLIISLFLLYFKKGAPLWERILFGIVIVYASLVHYSHLMIGTLLIGLTIIGTVLFRKKLRDMGQLPSLQRAVPVSALVLSAWFLLPSLNYLVASEFTFSKGSHVFMIANMNKKGVLKTFLDQNCRRTKYKNSTLCAHKDSLPHSIDAFIWNGDLVEKSGGWKGSKEEYQKIIHDILTDPGLLAQFTYKSVIYGFSQLTHNKVGVGLSAYGPGSPPHQQVEWRFKEEENDYLNSKQNKWGGKGLSFGSINTVHSGILILSLAFLIHLAFSSLLQRTNPYSRLLLLFVLVSIFLNAMVTAGLSAPYGRYQSRVVWLLPLAIILFIWGNRSKIRGHLEEHGILKRN